MNLDYYAILGVSPGADIEALRQAYRIRAFECHPDRGGSHGQMVLINEAWAILSNPITRRHYDSARRNRSDYVAQRSVREDAQAARQKAQEYPRKWPDFEAWLDRLFRDFTEVNYGTTEAGFGMQYPTAGRSVSGWLLIIAGGLFGLFVGSYIIFSLNIEHPIGRVLALSFMVGGAWLGVLLHDKIGKSLGKKEKIKLYQKKKNIITNDQKSKKNDQKLREQRERLKDPDGFTLKERQEWEQLLKEERRTLYQMKGENGQETMIFPDGAKYTGEFVNGIPNGQGTYTFSDGSKYVGAFKDGKCNGQGTSINPDGSKYIGEFKDHNKHGQGTYTYPDGAKYVGEFKNDKCNGQGTYTFSDGAKYVGEFVNGMPNGQGTIIHPNGAKYVGEFKDGKSNGQGTSINPDGSKYVGEFKDNKHNGQGTIVFPDGSRYVGEFVNNVPDGEGTSIDPDGTKYVGEFVNGMPNGQGTYTYPDGRKEVGEFKNGKFIGR